MTANQSAKESPIILDIGFISRFLRRTTRRIQRPATVNEDWLRQQRRQLPSISSLDGDDSILLKCEHKICLLQWSNTALTELLNGFIMIYRSAVAKFDQDTIKRNSKIDLTITNPDQFNTERRKLELETLGTKLRQVQMISGKIMAKLASISLRPSACSSSTSSPTRFSYSSPSSHFSSASESSSSNAKVISSHAITMSHQTKFDLINYYGQLTIMCIKLLQDCSELLRKAPKLPELIDHQLLIELFASSIHNQLSVASYTVGTSQLIEHQEWIQFCQLSGFQLRNLTTLKGSKRLAFSDPALSSGDLFIGGRKQRPRSFGTMWFRRHAKEKKMKEALESSKAKMSKLKIMLKDYKQFRHMQYDSWLHEHSINSWCIATKNSLDFAEWIARQI